MVGGKIRPEYETQTACVLASHFGISPDVAETAAQLNDLVTACGHLKTGFVGTPYLLHVLSVGEFTYEPGYDLRRSAFDSLLLEIILDGRVNLETEGETLAARAGQVVLIDCTKPHRYWSDTGWHALWVHFDGAAARGISR